MKQETGDVGKKPIMTFFATRLSIRGGDFRQVFSLLQVLQTLLGSDTLTRVTITNSTQLQRAIPPGSYIYHVISFPCFCLLFLISCLLSHVSSFTVYPERETVQGATSCQKIGTSRMEPGIHERGNRNVAAHIQACLYFINHYLFEVLFSGKINYHFRINA